ncbi:hypothetical protein PRK78_007102 [Emydomyces testavorans]|uniref:Uncharacterized protein n=1 Tax=Emydomyces testavorans TaxID=2070801 RepID=A0AAF0DQS0_9EURO|nr:hypothetical protein PRK78_007102 [Emydomyces testavorans]
MIQFLPHPFQEEPKPRDKRHYNIWVAGTLGSGRRGLIRRYTEGHYEYHVLWHEPGEKNLVFLDTILHVELFSVSGKLEISSLDCKVLDGILLLYSVTRRDSFELLNDVYIEIKNKLYDGQDPPVIVVAAMTDLPAENWQVQPREGKSFARRIGANFGECEALTGAGVDEVMDQLIMSMVEARSKSEQKQSAGGEDTNKVLKGDRFAYSETNEVKSNLFRKLKAILRRVFGYKVSAN